MRQAKRPAEWYAPHLPWLFRRCGLEGAKRPFIFPIRHPERVQAQFEGAAVFAASVALMGEITAANGQIQQSNYHDYPVARLTEAPYETHVHLLPSHDVPAGVGEPGVPPTIPALCNALFAATGKRIRQLPIKNTKLT